MARAPELLPDLLLRKLEEQAERIQHLLSLTATLSAGWTPPITGARPIEWLYGHLLECLAGFCAVCYAAYPDDLSHLLELRDEQLGRAYSREIALERLPVFMSLVRDGFAAIRQDDLARPIPTVFVPEGEALFTLLLGNLEHLISHKYQLLTYLKLAGVTVGTPDIYRFRE